MMTSKCNSNLSELKRIFRIGHNPYPQQGRNEWRRQEDNWAALPVIEAGGMGAQDRPTCRDIQPTTLSSMPPSPGISFVTCPLQQVILQKSCRGRSRWSQGRGHSMGFPVGLLLSDRSQALRTWMTTLTLQGLVMRSPHRVPARTFRPDGRQQTSCNF